MHGPRNPPGALVLLAYVSFVSLGLPDTVLGVVWPSIRETFGLPQALLAAPLAANATFYFVSGLLAGRLIGSLGIGKLLAVSTGLVAAGVFGFGAAPAFAIFVACGVLVGFGSGAVDSALNSYVARNFPTRHMSWLHAAYSVGATAGPALMTALISREAPWRAGYFVIAALLGVLALTFVFARHLWRAGELATIVADAPGGHGPQVIEPQLSAWSALRSSNVRLQIAAFFLYCGVEVTAGQWSYTILTESRGIDPVAAAGWVTLYWTGLLAGRVLSGFVVERIGNARLVRAATFGALAAAAVFAIPSLPPAVMATALFLLSFSLAPIYPGLMSETPRRVGKAAEHVVGFQVSAATLGIAAVPAIAGVVATKLGLSAIPVIAAVCALLLLLAHELLLARTRSA